jgi:hypothetical protein
MLFVIIALLWVALLAPVAIRRLRDGRAERSIESFHQEHEVLSRQAFTVPPAHRLSEPDEAPVHPDPRSSRLTVVHSDDTYRSLESRRSWEEWSEDYDYERHNASAAPAPINRYASAYASVPRDADVYDRYEPPVRRRTMRAQRRRIISVLASAVVFTTVLALVAGSSLLVDVAILSWVALAGYAALALYAISQGWLYESSLWRGRTRSLSWATVGSSYDEQDDDTYGDGDGASVIGLRAAPLDEPASEGWRRESRFALG